MGRADEWRTYLSELRAANKRRPRMMEVLDSIEGKRRRIVSGEAAPPQRGTHSL